VGESAPREAGGELEVVQEVQAVPVLSDGARERGLIRTMAPAKQAMMVAAGGFVAGAAVVGLAGRRRGHRSRPPARGRGARRGGRAEELVRIVGTRSLLVDVHLLGGR
jgi:hypothetical protein